MKLKDAVATWWLRNAEIRHGHIPPIGNVSVPESAQGSSLVAKALPYVLSAVLGGGGIAAVPFVLDWLGGKDAPPAVAVPEAQSRDGSLYQYLEDQNMHLPPE